jgi:hypothetical protein
LTETIAAIVAAHRAGHARPAETVARSFARIRAHGDAAVFISLRDEADAVAEANALAGPDGRPLYGVPVAIKDNIDVAGLPTTAACPPFRYEPDKDATVVARLRRAGAIVIGKTNLDQFATGLVGVRSPYGIPRNTVKPGQRAALLSDDDVHAGGVHTAASSITLTCAATTCQPWGKRTQVCIWRPTLPGMVSRRTASRRPRNRGHTWFTRPARRASSWGPRRSVGRRRESLPPPARGCA